MVTITLTFRVYNRNFFNSHIVWHIIEKNIYEITFIYLIHVLSVVYKTRIYKWSNRNFPIWSVKVEVKFLITAFFFSCECFKETLQLILRIKWDFSHGSLYFCCIDESINFQEITLFLKWKITVLSQKLIIFWGLVNKYCCLLLSFSWHIRRKGKQYQHGSQREKRTVWRPRNITDTAWKRLKGAREIILIHNTVYLRDQYMNDNRKRNK